MKKLLPLISLCLLTTAATGCAVATAGIKKGDERNFVRSVNDVSAGRVIEARMKRAYDFKLKGVDVEVAEGIVLLSGNVPNKEDRIEAARIAWSAPRVLEVGNEIMIKSKQGFIRNTKDGFLEKAVRTRMTADKHVKARNFNVETHDGIVYLMGVARTQNELERAAAIAATTKGAKEVISYARIADMPQIAQQASARPMPQSTPQPIPMQRDVPSFLTTQPETQAAAPIQSAPLSQPIPFTPPQQEASGGPTAPPTLNMGDKLNKEFPTDEELGAYRTGQAGEAVSIIESEPYYVDPDTGEEIPVRYDANGDLIPGIIR